MLGPPPVATNESAARFVAKSDARIVERMRLVAA
jgi:hypothetical protein